MCDYIEMNLFIQVLCEAVPNFSINGAPEAPGAKMRLDIGSMSGFFILNKILKKHFLRFHLFISVLQSNRFKYLVINVRKKIF